MCLMVLGRGGQRFFKTKAVKNMIYSNDDRYIIIILFFFSSKIAAGPWELTAQTKWIVYYVPVHIYMGHEMMKINKL